jgi:hypothetical protein
MHYTNSRILEPLSSFHHRTRYCILHYGAWFCYVVGREKRIFNENGFSIPRKYILWGFIVFFNNKWVPVNTARRVLRLRMEERPPIWRVAANILNKQFRRPTRGGPPDWWLGEVLISPYRKNVSCYEMFTQKASGLDSGTSECGNEPSVSIKCGEFLD